MNCKQKQYGKVFFKFFLLAIYFVFFSVQLFFRFDLSHSQQSLESDNYQKNFVGKSVKEKVTGTKAETKKDRSLTYLNKRFHPKNEIIVPELDFKFSNFYSVGFKIFYFPDNSVSNTKANSVSLRGPPALS
jgi:hypothetical protein